MDFRCAMTLLVCGLAVSCAPLGKDTAPRPPKKSPFAAVFTRDPAVLPDGGEVIDFEALAPGTFASPLVMGNATFSSPRGLGVVSLADVETTNVRDNTLQPVPYDRLQTLGYQTLTVTFAEPLTAVGLGWFDPNREQNRLIAYDARDRVLAEGSPAPGLPGRKSSAFVGVVAPEKVIAKIEVVPGSARDSYSIDNLTMVK